MGAMTVVPFRPRAVPLKEQPESGAREELLSMLADSLRGSGIESTLLDVLQIRAHLKSLLGHVSERNIQIRKEGLRGFTDDQLRDMVRNSTSSDWTARPAFYWALVELVEDKKLS